MSRNSFLRKFKFLKNKKGLNLVEIAIIIMILGLAVPPLMLLFAEIGQRSIQSEFRLISYTLGKQLMEEVLSKSYDESTGSPSTSLGTDSGENDRDEFDDVDDFDGYVESAVSGFPGFSRSVTVYYVDPDTSDYDTPQPDSAATNYKRIDVKVSHAKIGAVELSAVANPNR